MLLNLDQRRIIQAKPNGHAVLRGVAGSGKTTVAIQRVPFLLNHYCFQPDDAVLLLTYNKTLNRYIRYLYDKVENGEDDFQSIFGSSREKLTIETVDVLMFKYFLQHAHKNNIKLKVTTDTPVRFAAMSWSIAETAKRYPGIPILDPRHSGFLMDEVDWIRSCRYTETDEYQAADRLGRMGKAASEGGMQRIQKNSPTRQAIFELMTLFDRKLEEQGFIDMKLANLLALKEVKLDPKKRYTHVLVDESQDLTRVQMEFITHLLLPREYASILFVSDSAQSIYAHSWMVRGRSFTSIGFDMTGRSSILSKNYRTTTEISQAAYSLIRWDDVLIEDDNFVPPSLLDRPGLYPVYRACASPAAEAIFVSDEIRRLSTQYAFGDICLLAKTYNQLQEMLTVLERDGIPVSFAKKGEELDFGSDTVKLLTIHSAKGLEFKVVFLIGLNKKIIPYVTYQEMEDRQVQIRTERKLMYVGMTRANELLYLSSGGIPSPFVEELDPKCLRLVPTMKLRIPYPISVEAYRFPDRIPNLFSNEEQIRQWFLQELVEVYGYPEKLITVEYPLQSFSRKGLVDVAIEVSGPGGVVPFLFAEIKAKGTSLDEAVAQVRSYMAHAQACQFGVATDGCDVRVVNREGLAAEGIPMFQMRMLPKGTQPYQYEDWKHRKTFRLERDVDQPDWLEVTDGSDTHTVQGEACRMVKVFGQIAAGVPVLMNEEVQTNVCFPKEWFNPGEELFMLEVHGDSMKDAGVMEGDLVLMRKQDTAQTRDIVAVALSDEATLKRYVKMGDSILLMPENEAYEPIQVRDGEARILGVAIGLLKRV